ncbi:cysteine desulfurase [Candidatus Saccharibacteria bacterium]|nr:cysteine desulfurase [Candidatus Saccharibacteria bacterium]
MDTIYLDYAAATPMDEAAIAVMQPFLNTQFYNPSAIYEPARQVRKTLEAARATVADVLGSKDQEILFTAGGTEANNLAIHGVMQTYPGAHMIVSAVEHESVLEPAKQYDYSVVSVTNKGLIDVDTLKSLITPQTALISVMYANNEIGTIQPIKQLTELVNGVRTQRLASGNTMPLYVHTDACQAANYLDLHVSRLGVDLMTLNGGKIYSAKQSGCLYVEKSVHLKPIISGGGQERGLRSGTENVGNAVAFATMLQKVQNSKRGETDRLLELTQTLFATLSHNLPQIRLNGDATKRLPNNLNICIPGVDGERLVMELDEAGILAATGSACTASSDEPSHVLIALGLNEADASASLRLTLGRGTTETNIAQAVTTITDVIQKHRLLV